MLPRQNLLRFYFITDAESSLLTSLAQTEIALAAGATMVQYRHKSFRLDYLAEVEAIRSLCRTHQTPFVVNDDILLAKAVGADGVHLGQADASPALARRLLGESAVIGLSVSSLAELAGSELRPCDYIGCGPVFPTATKPDANPVMGVGGLRALVQASPLPVVAIGGINAANAGACFDAGAAGVAVITCISRATSPVSAAQALAAACGCPPRQRLCGWRDEFKLIAKLLRLCPVSGNAVLASAGDDAALLAPLERPVITTDTQREGVHFRRDWQTLEEIGQKAVIITFSDLAASYARPLALFVNLCIPSHTPEKEVEALYRGVGAALEAHGAVLGGGNIARGEALALELFAVGEGHPRLFPLRSGARPGDNLYVTGPLGLARAGLHCLEAGRRGYAPLEAAFRRPRARFDAAGVLANAGVSCVMDISDGLAGDAGHIAEASGVSIFFDLERFSIDPALQAYCEAFCLSPQRLMLAGGEDYELLFACSAETFDGIRKQLPGAFRVGRCAPFTGNLLPNLPAGITSFQHGGKPWT